MKALLRVVFLVGTGLQLVSGAVAREEWIHARTAHFEMFSCASEHASRELLNKLEQFRATVLQYLPLRGGHEPRATIILFDTEQQFEPYEPLYQGEAKRLSGYCVSSPVETLIALMSERDLEATMATIFHEYVHQLLIARGDQPPLFLNEGLADAFSTFKIDGDFYEVGQVVPVYLWLLEHVSEEDLIPLKRLCAMTTTSREYNEPDRQAFFYAESWAWVHFWVFGKDPTYRPKLARFLALSSEPGATAEDKFRTAFGMSFEEIEASFRRYLLQGHYSVTRGKLVLGDLSAQLRFQPADDFDRDLALADLRWRGRHPGDTAFRLMQMAKEHPASPRPHEVLAMVAIADGDWKGALAHWERAAELGSDNAFVYLQLADDRLTQVVRGLSLDYRLPAELSDTLRGWLDRAIALSPDYLDAYDSLALVEALSEHPRGEAMNRIQRAALQMRNNTHTLFAIALVRWRIGDYATSREVTNALLRSAQVSPELQALVKMLDERLRAMESPSAARSAGSVAPVTSAATPR